MYKFVKMTESVGSSGLGYFSSSAHKDLLRSGGLYGVSPWGGSEDANKLG